MIAGKTLSEILSMTNQKRYRWYKTISPEEKEVVMVLVESARRTKISAAYTPERKTKQRVRMTGKTFTHTEETKAKISAAHMGKTLSEEHKAKLHEANMGKTLSEETRAKISASLSGKNNPMYGKNHTEEANIKNREAHIGKTHTEESKAKISVKVCEWWTPERRDEQSTRMDGENNPSWQGGKSFEPYGLEFNSSLKNQIRARDNHTCQECGQTESELRHALDVHHIDYDKTNNSLENLITLCRSCHSQTGFCREDWTEYFKAIIENNKSS